MLPRDIQLLSHIQNYCEDISNDLSAIGNDYSVFLSDTMSQHSIAFCILQIGELAGKLSDNLRAETLQEINWPAIKGMRNIVVHDYGNVDLEIVWAVATEDIPNLKAACKKYTSL